MSSIYGKNLRVSVFGQSHSEAIGVTVDGLPSGFRIDLQKLNEFTGRRAPGKNKYSTKRSEADTPEFISGLVNNITCGAPLTAIIYNTDKRSVDYENIRDIPRPGHADFTAQMKYGGFQDTAGGGHFSGRLTAPLCIAGGICKQMLEKQGIFVSAHIKSIGSVEDDKISEENARYLKTPDQFPVIREAAGVKMMELIEKARLETDSVGGVIECIITGVPAGIGEPMFDGIENKISAIVFGLPAIKGIEFGNGFECTGLRGSENNDEFYYDGGKVKTKTNNHGGILGGITSGMPIIFRAAVKPTSSIAKEQNSISFSTKENTTLVIKGRHDPCIVPRAVPCIEAAASIAIFDAMLDK